MTVFDPTTGIIELDISDADKENILEGYNGLDLPSRLIGPGILSRVYITTTEHEDPMFKVLYKSTHPDYNGFPVWDNITLIPSAAFKWAPFCELIGVKTSELATDIKVDPVQKTAAGYPVHMIGNRNFNQDVIEVLFSVVYRKHKETGNMWPEIQFIEPA